MDHLPALDLLDRSANILLEAAQFYVSDKTKAVRARRKVNKTGADPFHACILSRLSLLSSLLGRSPSNARSQSDYTREIVAETLEVLDDLIFDVPETQSGWHYSGLHHLQDRYRADQIEIQRPKPLGYRMYLYCPSLENRQRLKKQLQLCCEVLEKASSERVDTPSILSEIEDIQEWKLAPGLTRHPERLQNLLRNYWHCSCKKPHGGLRVAFVGRKTVPGNDDTICGSYRICFSEATEPPQLWHAANVLMADQEGSSLSSRALSGGKTVRFSGIPLEQGWHNVRTLCEAFSRDPGPCTIRLAETRLETNDTGYRENDSLIPLVSLRTSLTSDSQEPMREVRPKERVVLGVVLCYLYLHVSGTSWWSQHDVRPNFWFTKTDSSINGFQVRQPFLNFANAELETKGSGVEKCINPHRPSLPALGKLLLEIWKGSEVEWKDLEATIEQCSQEETGGYWLCAINACLGADEALRAAGSVREDDHMRSIYVLKVIKSLQWLLEKVCRLSVDDAFAVAMEDKTAPRRPIKHKPESQTDRQNCRPDLPAAINKMCLHDDAKTWEAFSEKKAARAEEFLGHFDAMTRHYIPRDDLTVPVRVAIIDTGVSFDEDTARMYTKRIGGFRTWVGVEDKDRIIGMPQTLDDDTDGHGTHCVSTLLRVDPFCQVFVAKAFEGRNQKRGEAMEGCVQAQVLNAIKYCISVWKVNVISLSFGFDDPVDSIEDAIIEAGRHNIVVFAAASNCGGNDDASWPARHPTVISIYATDGIGNKYPRNPTPEDDQDKFATLGMEVKAWWKPGSKAYRSGTSVATPIAAGIASLIVHFLRSARSQYLDVSSMDETTYDCQTRRLLKYAAMRKALGLMVVRKRDGYSYIQPWKLLGQKAGAIHAVVDNLLKTIKKA